ncbi:LssY C-terminal domain-containing protein [Glaciibacter sp. 2TAF33]|uniref:LssY C-terminal domain-containing protein n=1 Tax=Glaciibacter sp. 2TAF33 TaxID=3233015 RepID=UPI003F8FC8C8
MPEHGPVPATTTAPTARSTPGRTAASAPAKVRARRKRFSVNAALDNFFFVFAGLASVWLAVLVFTESFDWGWAGIGFVVVLWALLAYLVLPRLHRILTQLYVPDYFIGRTRTSDGLLGDPVNLALDGSAAQLHASMTAAGWTRADEITLASGWRIVMSTLRRRSYDEAPVSPLRLFDRQQDFAYQQEVEDNPAKRHHVRFWKCPDGWMLPGGHRVGWLAAGTFDRAVGFSLFTLQVTHKIDANTDIERDHIVATLRAAVPEARVVLIRDFSTGYHSRNGGGDSIQTDGDLPVVDLRRVPVPGEQVPAEVLDAASAAEAVVVELRGVS